MKDHNRIFLQKDKNTKKKFKHSKEIERFVFFTKTLLKFIFYIF